MTSSALSPPGMKIDRQIFRQADLFSALDNLTAALRDGAVLLVVLVFLMNLRAAGITLLASRRLL